MEPLAWADLLALGPEGSFCRKWDITLRGEIGRRASWLRTSVPSVLHQAVRSVVRASARADDRAVNPLCLFSLVASCLSGVRLVFRDEQGA